MINTLRLVPRDSKLRGPTDDYYEKTIAILDSERIFLRLMLCVFVFIVSNIMLILVFSSTVSSK